MKGLAGVSLSNRSMKIPDHRESIFEPNPQFLCPWMGKDKNNNFYTLIIAYSHQTSRGELYDRFLKNSFKKDIQFKYILIHY